MNADDDVKRFVFWVILGLAALASLFALALKLTGWGME